MVQAASKKVHFSFVLPTISIDGKSPRSGKDQIKENEAEQDGAIATVENREKALRRVRHEIGERHQARCKECRWTREETDEDEDTADSFNNGSNQQHRRKRTFHLRCGKAKKLLGAMFDEQQRGDDAQSSQGVRLVSRQFFKKCHMFVL